MNIDYETLFKNIENNNLLNGVFFLTYLVGSRHVLKSVPKSIKNIFDMFLIRIFVIFSAIFVATKNVKHSLILSILYIVIIDFLTNPKSKLCLVDCKIEKERKESLTAIANNQTIIQSQQPGPQQQQIQTQLPPLQMDMQHSTFDGESFSNY